ncbi:hypothetical protein [Trinickia acidisoli]|uniref:hypothetical protein n=1 Tax=Trinickia acidisoli TaxID=2767482 RepID=UPI001A8EB874|nr:hypothetical protein [Trinickia acidisoli]
MLARATILTRLSAFGMLATLAACGGSSDSSPGSSAVAAAPSGSVSTTTGNGTSNGSGTGTGTGPSTSTPISAVDARPNDGSGYWPDFSNTGYANTPANAGGLGLPAYPGHLTDYAAGMNDTQPLSVTYPDGSVIAYMHFRGLKILIYGDNLTFVGCLFEGTDPNDNLVQIYSPTNITFRYSTFKPSAYAMPPGNDGTVSSAHSTPGTPFNDSWQISTTMEPAVVLMDHDDIWGNAGMEMVTGFPGHPSTWTNNYIHDAADTANNVYHQDGIGPQSGGNGGPMLIDHNTIASLGNTNGLALQGGGVYDHITFTNNYVSGWGYALSFGTSNNATNLTVTGNVFSAELTELWGPLYGNLWGGQAQGSTWRNNLYQVRPGDGNTSYTTADQGLYWWPTDNVSHSTDYAN